MQQARRFSTTLSLSDAARQHRQHSSNIPPNKAHTVVILDQTPAANATTYRLPYNLRDRDAVTAEELLPLGVVFTELFDLDSGDLTVAHFVQHNSWQERGDEDDLGLLPYQYEDSVGGLQTTTARAPREYIRAVSDNPQVKGARMPIASQRARWHHHVRERHPDQDD